MDLLNSFSCINHEFDLNNLNKSIIDLNNPCSFCKNNKVKNNQKIAFYIEEYEKWNFPFLIEHNCQNFERIITKGKFNFHERREEKLKKVEFIDLQLSTFDKGFSKNFFEIEVDYLSSITYNNRVISPQSMIFPNDLTYSEFSIEISMLRQELRHLSLLLNQFNVNPVRQHNNGFIPKFAIKNISKFTNETSQNLDLLELQIKRLLAHLRKRKNAPIKRVQIIKYILNTALGGSLWDFMKFLTLEFLTIVS